MTSTESQNGYHLLFEGTRDDAPETLRQVKIVFLADLDLSVERAQQILAEGPSIIRSAQEANELEPLRKRLTSAGALVHILAPNAEGHQNAGDGPSLEFSFEVDTPIHDITKTEKPAKVYELPVDEEVENSSDLAFDLNASVASLPKIETTGQNNNSELERVNEELLDLTLTDSSATNEQEQSDQSSNTPFAKSDTESSSLGALDLSFDEPDSDTIGNIPSTETPTSSAPLPPQAHSGDLTIGEVEPEPSYQSAIPTLDEEWSDDDLAPPELLQPHAPQIPAALSQPQATKPTEPVVEEPKAVVEEPTPQKAPEPVEVAKPLGSIANSVAPAKPQVVAESAADNEDPGVEPEVVIKNSKSKSKGLRRIGELLPLDVLMPVALSLLVLGVGNWWYFSGNGGRQTGSEVTTTIQRPLPKKPLPANPNGAPGIESAPAVVAAVAPKQQSKVRIYQIASDVSNLHLKGELLSDGNRLFVRSLSATVDPAPPLTTAEIVAKKNRAPDVTKIEIQDVLFEPASPGFFVGTGIAKLYIEYRENKTRLVTKATLKAQPAIDNASITLELQSVQGRTLDSDPGLKIEAAANDTFTLSMQAHTTATLANITAMDTQAVPATAVAVVK